MSLKPASEGNVLELGAPNGWNPGGEEGVWTKMQDDAYSLILSCAIYYVWMDAFIFQGRKDGN